MDNGEVFKYRSDLLMFSIEVSIVGMLVLALGKRGNVKGDRATNFAPTLPLLSSRC